MYNSIKVAIGLLSIACGIASVAGAPTAVNTVADFVGAKWIWTPAPVGGNYPTGNATFRRDYYPPSGKTPLSANILITTDDAYTLFVNGVQVGTGNDYTQAQRYCVPLIPSCNVFAVEGFNINIAPGPNPAGMLAVFQVRYTDGFIENVVTDSEWHGVTGVPAGFEQVAFDDSNWPAAFDQGAWPTAAPWGNGVAIPAVTANPGPNLKAASYIWTNEVTGTDHFAPVGTRAFRKVVTFPAGQFADTITIDISADDQYTLYVNGLVVGSGTNFQAAQRYQVNFIPSNTVTIAVVAANLIGRAGLIASGAVTGCVCGCGADAVINTDSSWKYSTTVPDGFINPGYDDSAWPAAVVEGGYVNDIWDPPVPIPTTNTAQNGLIPGAPSAPPASVVA